MEPFSIRTYTGRCFRLDDVDPESVDIVDISHALGNLCRFAGHSSRFYSIAQHSCATAAIAPLYGMTIGRQLQQLCLLHDASEAYCSDIVSPLKPMIDGYKALEKSIQDAIWKRFGCDIDDELMLKVKEIDRKVLEYESSVLLPKSDTYFGANLLTSTLSKVIDQYWSPDKAKSMMMEQYLKLFAHRL